MLCTFQTIQTSQGFGTGTWVLNVLLCRLRLEESDTVQCLSVAYQSAGAKKIQQDLAAPDILECYPDSNDEINQARSCFAGEYQILLDCCPCF